jgi:hypothetical protein
MNHKPSSTSVLLGVRTPVLLLVSLLCFVIAPVVSASTSTQLFFDDFTGTALDTSRWSVFVDIWGVYHWPYVADGLLYSQGYHTRIDSIPTFAPVAQSVTASASIRLGGDMQKFGFAVNPNEHAGPVTGYYFDTYSRTEGAGGGREGYVRALAWSNPGDGSLINLLDVEIPVTWYEFHEFAVERTPSEVVYSIDGQEVARVADAFAGALPVCVWNDRWDLMLTDWVEVSQIIRAIGVPIDIKPGSNPNSINPKSQGVIPVAILTTGAFDASTVDPSTVLFGATGTEAAPVQSALEDVDGDGDADMILHFNTQDTGIVCGHTSAALTGETFSGQLIEGSDSIETVGCK